jgi:hypothetical protein
MAPATCANPAVDGPKILKARCLDCHDRNTITYAAVSGLDLAAPDAWRRMINANATLCPGKVLINDRGTAVDGYVFEKITGTMAVNCGTRMPPIGDALKPDEVKCLKDWIRPTP